MLEYSLDVICSVDKAGRFIEVSSACQEVWGYSPEELRGRPVRELLHSDDVEKTTDVATAIAMGIYVKDFENRCLCKDGSVVDMLWSAHWSDVEQSMFCVARDMTERKEVQEQLRVSSEVVQCSSMIIVWAISARTIISCPCLTACPP